MGKLLAFAAFGKDLYNRWWMQQLLSSIILMLGLVIIIAMMTSILLIGGLYAGYLCLLSQGLEPNSALLILGAVILFIVALLTCLVKRCVRRLRALPRGVASSTAGGAVEAFIDGLLRG